MIRIGHNYRCEVTVSQAQAIIGDQPLMKLEKATFLLYNGASIRSAVIHGDIRVRKYYIEGRQQELFEILQDLNQNRRDLTKATHEIGVLKEKKRRLGLMRQSHRRRRFMFGN